MTYVKSRNLHILHFSGFTFSFNIQEIWLYSSIFYIVGLSSGSAIFWEFLRRASLCVYMYVWKWLGMYVKEFLFSWYLPPSNYYYNFFLDTWCLLTSCKWYVVVYIILSVENNIFISLQCKSFKTLLCISKMHGKIWGNNG